MGAAPGIPAVQSSKAVVTVQVEPRAPDIINGDMEVMEGTKVEITCKVREGKPPPTISWLDGKNEEMPDKKGKEKLIKETTENIEKSKLKNVISTLSLEVKKEMDQTNLTCQATHPTISKPKTAQIFLTVQYKPELTVAQGMKDAHGMKVAQCMTVVQGMTVAQGMTVVEGMTVEIEIESI